MKKSFNPQLLDRNKNEIYEDDVIFNGEHYFRIYFNQKQPQVEAISSTYGYLHDITQKEMSNFERIGTFEEYEHLLESD